MLDIDFEREEYNFYRINSLSYVAKSPSIPLIIFSNVRVASLSL